MRNFNGEEVIWAGRSILFVVFFLLGLVANKTDVGTRVVPFVAAQNERLIAWHKDGAHFFNALITDGFHWEIFGILTWLNVRPESTNFHSGVGANV